MNFFTRLETRLEAHAYKRGPFKGDAPADRCRRRKTQFRIVRQNGSCIAVRFWHTDIVHVFPDGSFAVNLAGFEARPAARAALNYALGAAGLGEFDMRITTVRPHGVRTVAIRDTMGNTYRRSNGMLFTPTGVLASEPRPFDGKRIDPDASRELREDLKASGFKVMFPLLVAGLGDVPPTYPDYLAALGKPTYMPEPRLLRDTLANPDRAGVWPTIVGRFGFDPVYSRHHNVEYLPCEPRTIWSRLMKVCKEDMFETYTTETLWV